ncbi:MAG: cytochrome c biogenesis protein CcsA [Myxococcales bacterium]|nr:cytochrome c biogenesis protein CcsA [Myxococcales bacterium]MCB9522118.1 cytochrome c biogenesis protein CcsA [Myxococcales bacterium]
MKLFPVFTALGAVGIAVGHWLTFEVAPMERTMRAAQRIFYFHVPSAWLTYIGFILCFGGSIAYLYNRKAKADAFALAAAEVGLLFGLIVVTTGPLWAKAAWGVWWVWEPRLTSMALLMLIFAAYWVLRTYGGRGEGVRRFAAVLAVFGAPNILFVHDAIRRFGGAQHPDEVVKSGLTNDMRVVLYPSLFALLIVFGLLLHLRYRAHRDQLTVRAIRRRLARLGA